LWGFAQKPYKYEYLYGFMREAQQLIGEKALVIVKPQDMGR
jgi:hypothetical protein